MNALTQAGQQASLTTPGFTTKAALFRLYTTSSTPSVDGTGFIEASGGGYAPKSINSSNWTWSVVSGQGRATLATQTFVITGTNLSNVGGAYVTDSLGSVLAWWEALTPATLLAGSTQTIIGLYVGGPFAGV